MIKIGIVGTGETIGIAGLHINAFQRVEGTEVVALYDILPGQAEKYVEKFELSPGIICSTYHELLDKVDAVVICTPNATHIDLTVEALKLGKHVLCEKPFGRSSEECKRALEYVELTGKVCMIGLCYRGVPGFRFMQQLINDGSLGEIYYVRQSQGGNRIANPHVKLEWRMQENLSGPGAIADFGSHMLDITDLLLREKYGKMKEVQCMEETYITHRKSVMKDEMKPVTNGDVAVFSAKTEEGVLLSFTASRIGSEFTMEVYGSGGYALFNGETPFELTIQKKDIDGGFIGVKEVVPVPEELYMEDENVPKAPFVINFYLQAKDFLRAITESADYDTDFERGMYIQQLIDSLQIAADTGEKVTLDF